MMRGFLILGGLWCWTATAEAHFLWLEPVGQADGTTTVNVYFSEDASPDDPQLLDRLAGMRLWRVSGVEPPAPLKIVRGDQSLSARVPGPITDIDVFIAALDYGVIERGDSVFRLKYYAKTGPPISSAAWERTECSDDLRFDLVPRSEGGRVRLEVRFDGKPVGGAQVVASGPGMPDFEGATTRDGVAAFVPAKAGLYSIRVRHIESGTGEQDGRSYQETRHYATLALSVSEEALGSSVTAVTDRPIPPLPQPVTSFGGAICGDFLYVYGGHTGSAHSYSTTEQGHTLRRVPLAGGEWETVAEGPPLQGLSLVSHGGKLYRIGGFTAKNAEGEEHDLWSQDDVACFDPESGQWANLPPLPEPRSSHDAAVLGDAIYVVGGWAMAGDAEHIWHESAWRLDLSQPNLEWKPVPTAPFQRRALTAAAHDGRLYVIGGMQPEGGPTTRVAIYDPATAQWSEGPALVSVDSALKEDAPRDSSAEGARRPGDLTGFGASAFATGGTLYVSTIRGELQRLNDEETAWEIMGRTPTARFFHRLLPVDDRHLLVVGGANMQTGKFEVVEILKVR